MILLFISFAVLIIGYFVYGMVTEKIFSPDNRAMPAVAASVTLCVYLFFLFKSLKNNSCLE